MKNDRDWAVVREFFETLHAHIIDQRLVRLMQPLPATTIPELVLSQKEFERLADEYGEEHRQICLTLRDRVAPAATRIGEAASPAVREAMDRLEALMSSLHDHYNRCGEYFYWRHYYEEALQRASILEQCSIRIPTTPVRGRAVQRDVKIQQCPICQRTENTFAAFRGPELRDHFQDIHPEPERDEFIERINDSIIEGRRLVEIAPIHEDSQNTPSLSAAPDHEDSDPERSVPRNTFRKKNDCCWEIRFAGEATTLSLQTSLDGLIYISALLNNPYKQMSCVDLKGLRIGADLRAKGITTGDAGFDDERPMADGSGFDGGLSDDQAVRDYSDRLKAIPGDLDRARERKDTDRVEELKTEAAWLAKEISRSKGLHGIRTNDTDDGTARISVSKAIGRAIKEVTKANKELGSHLSECIHTGTSCRYEPPFEQGFEWET